MPVPKIAHIKQPKKRADRVCSFVFLLFVVVLCGSACSDRDKSADLYKLALIKGVEILIRKRLVDVLSGNELGILLRLALAKLFDKLDSILKLSCSVDAIRKRNSLVSGDLRCVLSDVLGAFHLLRINREVNNEVLSSDLKLSDGLSAYEVGIKVPADVGTHLLISEKGAAERHIVLLDLGVCLGNSSKEAPLIANDLALGRNGNTLFVKRINTTGFSVNRFCGKLLGLYRVVICKLCELRLNANGCRCGFLNGGCRLLDNRCGFLDNRCRLLDNRCGLLSNRRGLLGNRCGFLDGCGCRLIPSRYV